MLHRITKKSALSRRHLGHGAILSFFTATSCGGNKLLQIKQKISIAISLLIFFGCDASFESENSADRAKQDGNTTEYGDSTHGEDVSDICVEEGFEITSNPPNLLIVLDRSVSMGNNVEGTDSNRWKISSEAIVQLIVDFNDRVRIGLATFSSCLPGGCSPGSIQVPIPSDSTASIHSAEIQDYLGNLAGEGSVDGAGLNADGLIQYLCDSQNSERSTGASLAALVGEKSILDAGRANAVLLLTDGAESGECIVDEVDGATGAQLLFHQKPRVRTFAIGFQEAISAEINEIAKAGGTSTGYFADDPAQLIEALTTATNDLASSCVYDLRGLDKDADKKKVNFYLGEEVVEYDKDCKKKKGWSWTDKSKTAVEFCKDACDKVFSNTSAEVTATSGCETVSIN